MTSVYSTPPLHGQNKVPEITLTFWIIKVLSTTVGETAADYLAVNAGWGQSVTRAVMCALLCAILALQVGSARFRPWLYWLAVVLVSIVGTQITDLLTDGLNVSLYLSTAIFAAALAAIFSIWYASERTLSMHTIVTRRRESFYWAAILCTFALGTAAGDLATEATGLGFARGVIIFGVLIFSIWLLFRAGVNAVATFWLAYILTRPFGAALGDLLTQARTYGGLGFGAQWTSALFLAAIVGLVAMLEFNARSRRADSQPLQH